MAERIMITSAALNFSPPSDMTPRTMRANDKVNPALTTTFCFRYRKQKVVVCAGLTLSLALIVLGVMSEGGEKFKAAEVIIILSAIGFWWARTRRNWR